MPISSQGLTFEHTFLQAHNQHRRNHNTAPLAWSETLAAHAQQWADILASKDKLEHASVDIRNGEGENLAMVEGKELSGDEATGMWYVEVKDYDFDTVSPVFNPETGHFTQVVWATTTQVGGGVAKSKSGNTYVVGRYFPSGNVKGGFLENIKRFVAVVGDDENPHDKLQPPQVKENQTTSNSEDDESFQEGILNAHNECRRKHSTNALLWSDELAAYAQTWANYNAKLGKLQLAPVTSRLGQGENLASAGGKYKHLTGRNATMLWYNEIKNYDLNAEKPSYNPKTAHFTQVIWAESTHIGAGIADAENGMTFIVVRYSPPGNNIGKWKGNVKKLSYEEPQKLDQSQKESATDEESQPRHSMEAPATKSSHSAKDTFERNNSKNMPSTKILQSRNLLERADLMKPHSIPIGNDNPSYNEQTDLAFLQEILQAHNECRAKHDTTALQWSSELAQHAQHWADNLANTDTLQHASRDGRNGEGENLASARGRVLTGRDATLIWYDEIKDYNFNAKPQVYNPKCGHFTQVVWAGTTELGAGIAQSRSGRIYVVARYKPAGNVVNRFEGNVNRVTTTKKHSNSSENSVKSAQIQAVKSEEEEKNSNSSNNNNSNSNSNINNNSNNKNNTSDVNVIENHNSNNDNIDNNIDNNSNIKQDNLKEVNKRIEQLPIEEKYKTETHSKQFPWFSILACIVGVIVLCLQIASLTSQHWITAGAFRRGLWKSCQSDNNCISLPYINVELWVRFTRAFCILAVLSSAAGLFFAFLRFINKSVRGYFGAIPFFMSSVFALIGVVVFTTEISAPNIDYSFGWSYVLAWLGTAFTAMTGCLLLREN